MKIHLLVKWLITEIGIMCLIGCVDVVGTTVKRAAVGEITNRLHHVSVFSLLIPLYFHSHSPASTLCPPFPPLTPSFPGFSHPLHLWVYFYVWSWMLGLSAGWLTEPLEEGREEGHALSSPRLPLAAGRLKLHLTLRLGAATLPVLL